MKFLIKSCTKSYFKTLLSLLWPFLLLGPHIEQITSPYAISWQIFVCHICENFTTTWSFTIDALEVSLGNRIQEESQACCLSPEGEVQPCLLRGKLFTRRWRTHTLQSQNWSLSSSSQSCLPVLTNTRHRLEYPLFLSTQDFQVAFQPRPLRKHRCSLHHASGELL